MKAEFFPQVRIEAPGPKQEGNAASSFGKPTHTFQAGSMTRVMALITLSNSVTSMVNCLRPSGVR